MTGNTLECLTKRQVPGLKKLRIDNYFDGREEEEVPDILGIDTLTIGTGMHSFCLAMSLFENRETLDGLCLTAEPEELRSTGGLRNPLTKIITMISWET